MPTPAPDRTVATTISRFRRELRSLGTGWVSPEDIDRISCIIEVTKEEGQTFAITHRPDTFSPAEFKQFIILCCEAYSETTGDIVVPADPDDM